MNMTTRDITLLKNIGITHLAHKVYDQYTIYKIKELAPCKIITQTIVYDANTNTFKCCKHLKQKVVKEHEPEKERPKTKRDTVEHALEHIDELIQKHSTTQCNQVGNKLFDVPVEKCGTISSDTSVSCDIVSVEPLPQKETTTDIDNQEYNKKTNDQDAQYFPDHLSDDSNFDDRFICDETDDVNHDMIDGENNVENNDENNVENNDENNDENNVENNDENNDENDVVNNVVNNGENDEDLERLKKCIETKKMEMQKIKTNLCNEIKEIGKKRKDEMDKFAELHCEHLTELRNGRMEKEKSDEMKRKFECDRMAYSQIKNDIANDKFDVTRLPSFFINIYNVMDEMEMENTLHVDNAFDIFKTKIEKYDNDEELRTRDEYGIF